MIELSGRFSIIKDRTFLIEEPEFRNIKDVNTMIRLLAKHASHMNTEEKFKKNAYTFKYASYIRHLSK